MELLVAYLLFVGLVVAPVMLVMLVRTRRHVRVLAERIAGLESAVPVTIAPPETPPVRADAPTTPAVPLTAPSPGSPGIASRSWRKPEETTTPREPEPPVRQPAPRTPIPASTPTKSFEERIGANWMIWVGGLALALSAVFLFSFAVEQGWLGPWVRVGLGLALGGGLIAAGEALFRRDPERGRAGRLHPAAAALIGAGLFALFVALFAAHALYGLFGATPAFVLFALVSGLGLVLALRFGWPVALTGIVGGYLIPALVGSGSPDPVPVFIFLAVLTGLSLVLLTGRKWWFLAIATITGALAWPFIWGIGTWDAADQATISTYLLVVATLFAVFPVWLPSQHLPRLQIPGQRAPTPELSLIGFTLAGVVLVWTATLSDFNQPAFIFVGFYGAIALAMAWRRSDLEVLSPVGAAAALLTAGLWPAPLAVSTPLGKQQLGEAGGQSFPGEFGSFVLPPEFGGLVEALLGYGLLFGVGGFVLMRRAAAPGLAAAVSALVPLAGLVLAYWRIDRFEVSAQWSLIAVALAVAFTAAAILTPRMVARALRDLPLSIYCGAATAALALSLTCLLREAWLTVALALEVLALAWIWSRLRVPQIRWLVVALAGVVTIRLTLNHSLLGYGLDAGTPFNWVLYGYGIPAIAFLGAGRLLGDPREDLAAAVCETAALAFLFFLVALQLRIRTAGGIATGGNDLFDMSVQTAWWLIAAGLLQSPRLAVRLPWLHWGASALLAAAAAQIFLGHLIARNPLFVPEPVTGPPLFNVLALAYLLPALLTLALLATGRLPKHRLGAPIATAAAGALAFVWITLEIRHFYQGADLGIHRSPFAGNAEMYTYSAVWLLVALALLGIALVRNSALLRAASLAVLIVTVLKVFLYDMSDLTGLYRVASFLGLGLILIMIGQIYRRYVFTPAKQALPE